MRWRTPGPTGWYLSCAVNRIDLVVGPNGAGKSTFVALTLAPLPPGSVVVNADEIAKQRWPDAVASHAYDVAQVAAATRSKLIELRRPFIAETVFSHRSELDLIRAASDVGYTVVLHVPLVPEELAVERVKQRVQADVARSLWALVAHAVVNRPVRASTTTLGSTAHGSSPR